MCGWPPPGKRSFGVQRRGRLQSCVRPVGAVRVDCWPCWGPRTESSSFERDRCPDETPGLARLRRIDPNRASRGAWLAGLSGSNEQILGAKRQILGRGKATKKCSALPVNAGWEGPNWITHPPCLTCPGRQWLGPFSIHGSDEQIFGLKEQILGQDQSD